MPEFEEEEELLEEEEEGQASEMYEHHRIEADNGQNLLRVDKFLMSRLPNASRTKIQDRSSWPIPVGKSRSYRKISP